MEQFKMPQAKKESLDDLLEAFRKEIAVMKREDTSLGSLLEKIQPELLTNRDRAYWSRFQSMSPGDPGLDMLIEDLAGYRQELHTIHKELVEKNVSTEENESSNEFMHAIGNLYMIESMRGTKRAA